MNTTQPTPRPAEPRSTTSASEGRGKRVKLWYIKERHNPQLGIYYVAKGQMFKTAARKHEAPGGYGYNIMHSYATEREYNDRLADLRARGESVQ